jgi:protein gp37
MSALSSIEWTDRTWNPLRGCSIVSPGCVNCYAMKFAHRFSGAGKPYEGLTKQTKAGPQWTGKVKLVEDALLEPLKWRKPQRVFVNSMSDLFHEGVSDEFIDRVFAVMSLASRHTFQILTKRPERMLKYLAPGGEAFERIAELAMAHQYGGFDVETYFDARDAHDNLSGFWPLPNVWLGVSCEDQQRADERITLLLQTPAAVRFISAEPLLGPIQLHIPTKTYGVDGCDHCCNGDRCDDITHRDRRSCKYCRGTGRARKLDWVIVGGESGPGARPCDVAWIRSIVQQCQAASVPVFVKQLGSVPVMDGEEWAAIQYRPLLSARNSKHGIGGVVPLALRESKGGDPADWAQDLRVREFPATEARS